MPTAKPRYMVTDTGGTSELLDLAAQVWPEIEDRRQLLLRLAETGGEALRERLAERASVVERQRESLARARDLVDAEILLDDSAWT